MKRQKITNIITIILLVLSFMPLSGCQKPIINDKDTIFIFYTNDIHGCLSEELNFSDLAALKKAYTSEETTPILVDCGDATTGDTIASLSHGNDIVRLMNSVEYDVAIPGNHEFDYSIDTFQDYVKTADFPYICANLTDNQCQPILSPWTMIERNNKQIAFIGVLTPLTINNENAALFTNQNKDSWTLQSDQALYTTIQKATDEAHEAGADYVILLSHLGTNNNAAPCRSIDVINHTSGIDAVLDGHSHSIIEEERVLNKNKETVLLSSTGSFFTNIGCLSICSDGTISTHLLNTADLHSLSGKTADTKTAKLEQEIIRQFEQTTKQIVGHTDHLLNIYDPQTGTLLVKNQQTELGTLSTKALCNMTNADIAILAADRFYADIEEGDITIEDLLSAFPYADNLCLINASGQEIIEALEWSLCDLPNSCEKFLQISGLSYNIDSSKKVNNITINNKALEPTKEYQIVGDEHLLKYQALGYSMFSGSQQATVLDKTIIDALVLWFQQKEN